MRSRIQLTREAKPIRARRRALQRRRTRPVSRVPRPALGLAALLHRRQYLGAALSPWIELVRREAALPRLQCLVALTVEPERASQLEVCLDQPRPKCDRLSEEG